MNHNITLCKDINQFLNPLAVLHRLKTGKGIAPPYYLHIYQGCTEIGFGAKAQLKCLNGEKTENHKWVHALRQLCDQAADENSKAFGYIAFDACHSTQGFSPDKNTCFPLVQFFIPEHRIRIKNDALEYNGPDAHLLEDIVRTPISPRDFEIPRFSHCAEFSEDAFMRAVARAKQRFSYDLNKVVLSRYIGFDYDGDLPELFNAYCLNQIYSDAILMDFGQVGAAIASPELLLQSDSGIITANPLAGTRAAGKNASENSLAEKLLLCDRKELAEHVLGLAQVFAELEPFCETDTLAIKKFLNISYQSNLMHLSSELKGCLKKDAHCVDAMLALFPGTMVSGVSKTEAIRCIRDIEPFPRGLYAGAAGWASGRDCRFSLIIRSLCKYGSRLFVQAGAGILAESDPVRENQEVNLKMSAMLAALGCAGS